jgi:hypothetical protein
MVRPGVISQVWLRENSVKNAANPALERKRPGVEAGP